MTSKEYDTDAQAVVVGSATEARTNERDNMSTLCLCIEHTAAHGDVRYQIGQKMFRD
jgi:hypothetical protein